jgi:cytochrome c-type biogenesis protein CcmE
MSPMRRRLVLVLLLAMTLAVIGGLLTWLNYEQVVALYTPSDLSTNQMKPGQRFQVGGFVVAGSIMQGQNFHAEFAVTDGIKDMKVSYDGPLPNLLRDGKCVVAGGVLGPTGAFVADEIHVVIRDTTRFPPEVADMLKRKGLCQE